VQEKYESKLLATEDIKSYLAVSIHNENVFGEEGCDDIIIRKAGNINPSPSSITQRWQHHNENCHH